jgi:hypothetical protein
VGSGWVDDGTVVRLQTSTDKVGIGTSSPSKDLEVAGEAQITSSSTGIVLNVSTSGSPSARMVTVSSTPAPDAGADLLELEAGGTFNDFQFIECQRSTMDRRFRVWGNGDVTADGQFTGGGADFAEMVPVTTGYSSVEAGDVMVIDPSDPKSLVRSTHSRSTLVAGIYSAKPGFVASEHDWDQIALEKAAVGDITAAENAEVADYPVIEVAAAIDEIPLAIMGIVPCKVSEENGPIRPGDLLVTSDTPGHAMRDDNPAVGTVIGKALEFSSGGTAVIKILVTLQ